jgi:flagellar hook-basal body complex protein FliE
MSFINSTNGFTSLPPIGKPPTNIVGGSGLPGGLATGGTESTDSFKNYLVDQIQQVNAMQKQAETQVESLFTGGNANPAEVLTAVQKADLAFKMMMQVRNKLVQVYQEVKDIRI